MAIPSQPIFVRYVVVGAYSGHGAAIALVAASCAVHHRAAMLGAGKLRRLKVYFFYIHFQNSLFIYPLIDYFDIHFFYNTI